MHPPLWPTVVSTVALLALASDVLGGRERLTRDRHRVTRPVAHLRSVMLSRAEDDDQEPSLALGPDSSVYITAIRDSGRTVLWVSRDGGRTFGDPTMPVPHWMGDVQIAADDTGGVYITGIGRGLDLTTSRDKGRTFTTRTIESQELRDKPELIVSRTGRDLYVAFDGRHGPTVMISHDGAATWERSHVFLTDSMHHWPTAIALAGDQHVYFTASTFMLARLSDSITENTMRIFSSADRGRTWEAQILGRGSRTYGGCVHNPSCRVKVPFPSIAADAKGHLYAVYNTGEVRQPYRLYFVRSSDGGHTWSPAVELTMPTREASHDRADIGIPAIVAANDGLVYVVWSDDRTGPESVWAKRSRNGGKSWSADVRLFGGDQPMAPGLYGDYSGLAIDARGALHVAWSEGVGTIPDTGRGKVWYAQWDGQLP